MPARRPTRTLAGVAVGITVTALMGTSIAVPANAGPIDRDQSDLAARKIDARKATALPDKWFVQVSGRPTLRGGSSTGTKASQASVKDAAADAGVKYSVLHSYTRVWNGFSVKASQDQVQKLRTLPGVSAIYPVFSVSLPEKASEPQLKYSLPTIGATAAEISGYNGENIKVGIIDTGIDYNHPDLGGSGTKGTNDDFGPGAPRVKYGWDFVGDDYNADSNDPDQYTPNPDPYPDDCNGHGTHVAGTIGADGDVATGHARGVAPKVTLGAYRIFGCEGSADTEVILAAMERAAADDMDVINMSLGSDFESWPDYPEAAAASALTAAGTLVVASAGNYGDAGPFTSGGTAVGKDVIAVASVENTNTTNWYFSLNPGGNVVFVPADRAPAPPNDGTFPIARASVQNGCAPLADLTGKIALIQRGTCDFSAKAVNAQNAGAVGVVMYNNDAGMFNLGMGNVHVSIPVVAISQEEGQDLWTQLGGSPTTLTWHGTLTEPNPAAGSVSDFSSFGLAADLTLKPDVAAPGGNIWSTVPLEQASYANYSGTSMAAPHVTGAVALLLQAKPTLKGNLAGVRAALQNTAKPINKLYNPYDGKVYSGSYEPTARQGAGLIQIDKAITAATKATTVTPGKISLGENRSSYYKTTLKLTNAGSSAETYNLSVLNAVNVGPKPTSYWYYFNDKKVSAKYSTSSVRVKARSTASVSVYLKQPSGLSTGWMYGGWVRLTKSDKTKTLVVPFAGMYGDYQKVKVLQDIKDWDDDAGAFYTYADLPALATSDKLESIIHPSAPRVTFSMAGADVPHLLFHFDYPVNAAYFNVYKASSTGGKGAEVFPGYRTFLQVGKFGRDNSWWSVPFTGKIPFSNRTDSGLTVPDGQYVLELRVLKALGSSSTTAHWESYVSPAFTIHRAQG